MYARYLQDSLLAALVDTPVVFLQGPRQSGKSTLVQFLLAGPQPARYITLDDPAVLAAAGASPHDFIARLDPPVAIDEVQLVPELFRAIKRAVDAERKPGRFLLSGSSNVLLAPKLSESLAGRMEILTLWPLSQGEIAGAREGFIDAAFSAGSWPAVPPVSLTRRALVQAILAGGYPEAVARTDANRRAAWFNSYLTTIIERDIRHLAAIEGLTQMPRLLTLLAAQTGGLLNVAGLSRDLGWTQPTLARYLTLLQATHLYRPLPAWLTTARQRLIKREKVYLGDTGLAGHLRKAALPALVEGTDNLGPLLEAFVGQELRKQASWSCARPDLFYYRTVTGREVDFVLEGRDGRVVGIEVKASVSISAADLAGLRDLAGTAGKKFVRGMVLYLGREVLPFGEDILAMPVTHLWMTAP